jgi:hypothetical protein
MVEVDETDEPIEVQLGEEAAPRHRPVLLAAQQVGEAFSGRVMYRVVRGWLALADRRPMYV